MTEKAVIFVADDDASVRRALERLLTVEGWRVEVFADGATLLDRLPFWDAGCIVLDVCMPGIAGDELQRRIRAKAPTLPVVFVTAESALPLEMLRAGVIDVLYKPVDADALIATIRRALAWCGGPVRRPPHLGVVA